MDKAFILVVLDECRKFFRFQFHINEALYTESQTFSKRDAAERWNGGTVERWNGGKSTNNCELGECVRWERGGVGSGSRRGAQNVMSL